MLFPLFIAAVLVATTVALHSVGFGLILGKLIKSRTMLPAQPWPITWLLIRIAWTLIVIHILEVSVWAVFYLWEQCLPDAESAFYFSGVTYTTLGYGDVVLSKPWRLLGPIEALTGILMCGLSAGLFFAVVTAVYLPRAKAGGIELSEPKALA